MTNQITENQIPFDYAMNFQISRNPRRVEMLQETIAKISTKVEQGERISENDLIKMENILKGLRRSNIGNR